MKHFKYMYEEGGVSIIEPVARLCRFRLRLIFWNNYQKSHFIFVQFFICKSIETGLTAYPLRVTILLTYQGTGAFQTPEQILNHLPFRRGHDFQKFQKIPHMKPHNYINGIYSTKKRVFKGFFQIFQHKPLAFFAQCPTMKGEEKNGKKETAGNESDR